MVRVRESRIGRIQAFIDTWNAAFITLNGQQMITFEVHRWHNAKGGMRCAFPPYGLRATEFGMGSGVTCRKIVSVPIFYLQISYYKINDLEIIFLLVDQIFNSLSEDKK